MENLVILILIVFFIVDMFLYSLTPRSYLEKFDPFWRRIILGSGIWLFVMYHIKNHQGE